jgi:hypothetical protein
MKYAARIEGSNKFEQINAESNQSAADNFYLSLSQEEKLRVTSNNLSIEVADEEGINLIKPLSEEERKAQEKAKLKAEKNIEAERKAKEERLEAERKAKEERLESERKAKEERRKEKRRKAEEERKSKSRELAGKLVEKGFRSLDNQDLLHIGSIVDAALSSSEDLIAEEKLLAESALSDSATYRFLNLKKADLAAKNQVALNERFKAIAQGQAVMAKSLDHKLSDISSKAGGIKAGTAFAGLAAAKHLGEDMAEDF